jgi:hypothetical protein
MDSLANPFHHFDKPFIELLDTFFRRHFRDLVLQPELSRISELIEALHQPPEIELALAHQGGDIGPFVPIEPSILEMDVKTDSIYNTGILIRCIDAPKNTDTCKVSLYGYQVKIDPTTRSWTGGIFDDYGKTWHWLYSLVNDSIARGAYAIAKWNHFRIEAINSNIKVWVNGIPTTNLINQKYTSGYIALKIHALADKPEREKIFGQFKNIRIITKNPEKYLQQMYLKAIEAQ